MATPTSIPLPVVTHDQRTFSCKHCGTAMLYGYRSNRSLWRRSNIEVSVVSSNKKASHHAKVLLHDGGNTFELEDTQRRGRVDFTAGVNVDDIEWPLKPTCNRCGHTLGLGLGRRRFDKLMAGDDPIRI